VYSHVPALPLLHLLLLQVGQSCPTLRKCELALSRFLRPFGLSIGFVPGAAILAALRHLAAQAFSICRAWNYLGGLESIYKAFQLCPLWRCLLSRLPFEGRQTRICRASERLL